MSEKTRKKKNLLDLLGDLVEAIDRSTAENKRMRGVWERASKPKTEEKETKKK